MLHFFYTTKPFSRKCSKSPADSVIDDLKRELPNYAKGDKAIFSQLIDNTKLDNTKLDVAIERAKQANEEAKKVRTDNPSTEVYMLVEYLRNLKGI